MQYIRSARSGTALLGAFAAALAAAHPPAATIKERLSIRPEIRDEEERTGLSGAACSDRGVCLTVSDEKRYARFFRLHGNRLEPGEQLFLLPRNAPDGSETGEADAEGVAFANGFFYIAGSHSRSKSGEAEPSRHFLFRFPAPAGIPGDDIGSSDAPSAAVERATLDPVIAAHPLLRRRLREPPGETEAGRFSHGISIEGIAVSGGRLFVGFRGPVDASGAIVLSLPVDRLFGRRRVPPSVTHRVDLGGGQGVRDLAAVRNGMIILAGPETRLAAANPQLFFWAPGTLPVRLGPIAGISGIPESITVVEETDRAYRILVIPEGEGDPIVVLVDKPGA